MTQTLPADIEGPGKVGDGLGTAHYEAGDTLMGAGPALFPTLGSANRSLSALPLARRRAVAFLSPEVGDRAAALARNRRYRRWRMEELADDQELLPTRDRRGRARGDDLAGQASRPESRQRITRNDGDPMTAVTGCTRPARTAPSGALGSDTGAVGFEPTIFGLTVRCFAS